MNQEFIGWPTEGPAPEGRSAEERPPREGARGGSRCSCIIERGAERYHTPATRTPTSRPTTAPATSSAPSPATASIMHMTDAAAAEEEKDPSDSYDDDWKNRRRTTTSMAKNRRIMTTRSGVTGPPCGSSSPESWRSTNYPPRNVARRTRSAQDTVAGYMLQRMSEDVRGCLQQLVSCALRVCRATFLHRQFVLLQRSGARAPAPAPATPCCSVICLRFFAIGVVVCLCLPPIFRRRSCRGKSCVLYCTVARADLRCLFCLFFVVFLRFRSRARNPGIY